MPQRKARFTILHVSDPHWIHPEAEQYLEKANTEIQLNNRVSKKEKDAAQALYKINKHKLEEAKRYYGEISTAFKRQRLDHHFRQAARILVHTGDSANFYDYHKSIPMDIQFNSISDKLMKLLLETREFDRKFAVPGNHDTKRALHRGPEDETRFEEFKLAFKGWDTPFSGPSAPVENNGVKIAFLPLNSCRYCGIDTTDSGEVYDEIVMDTSHINKWSESEIAHLSAMKIALAHHNPLPNHGETARIAAKEVFVNNGDFNQSLIAANFKLVLSGHKHIGDEIYTAMPRYAYPNLNEGSWAKPMIECGFLAISAPTLLRYEGTAVQTGFYVIEIEITPNENIALLNVTRYYFDLSDKRLTPKTFPYRVALTRLGDIGLSEARQKASIVVLDKITRRIYTSNSVQPLQRVLNLTAPIRAVDDLLTTYRQRSRIDKCNVFGIYSAAVMPPESWWAYEIADSFLEIFIDYVRRRSSCTKARHQSITLKHAIQNSLENAVALRQSINSDSENRQKQERLLKKLENDMLPWLNSSVHAHFTGTLSSITNLASEGDVLSWDIPLCSPQSIKSHIEGVFEIARILLWPLENFESEYAFHLIKFHEQFGVPLFWLNPRSLLGLQGLPRKELGTLALWSFVEPYSTGERVADSPHVFFNNHFGERPAAHETYSSSTNEQDSLNDVRKLWGINNMPESFGNYQQPRLAEIASLLKRPDIFFAIDIWFAQNTLGSHHIDTCNLNKLRQLRKWLYS